MRLRFLRDDSEIEECEGLANVKDLEGEYILEMLVLDGYEI